VQIEPSVSLRINGSTVTSRQLEALVAVHEKGSQSGGAKRLGISTPVLHRYISQLEARTGSKLVSTSRTGTRLTGEGRAVVREYIALKERAYSGESTVVGCSIVTEDLLLSVLSRIDTSGPYDLIISDDERNLKDFRAGLMDIAVIDDPLNVYEFDDARWEEVAEDQLIHVNKGSKYMRYRYGAQRIGFRHLESEGMEYNIIGTVRSLPMLMRSNLSYFVNQSLVEKRRLRLESSTPPQLLSHKIFAMMSDEGMEVQRLVRALKRRKL